MGGLLHAREQMSFNAVVSPRVSKTPKSGKVMATVFGTLKV